MSTAVLWRVVAAMLCCIMLATSVAAAASPPATTAPESSCAAGTAPASFHRVHVHKYVVPSPPPEASRGSAQAEAGVAFMTSLATSAPGLPPPPVTVKASDSLTGLPYLMTFEQQLAGGLPVNRFPLFPTTSQPPAASSTAHTAAPATPVPAAAPTPVPAPATPAPASTGCSKTDSSPGAVHACINAVRTQPAAWRGSFPCDSSAWISEFTARPRPALRADSRLASSASRQAKDMASTRTVSHVGSDGSSMAQRIAAAGYRSFPQAENVAGGFNSAFTVTMGWMCSQGHRSNLMSCSLDSVGTATAYDTTGAGYFVQDFGCSTTNACHC